MVEDWIKPPPPHGPPGPSTLTPPTATSAVQPPPAAPDKPVNMIELRRRALDSALELEIQDCRGGKPSPDKIIATAQAFERYILHGEAPSDALSPSS